MDLLDLLNSILQDYSDVKISALTGIERTRLNRIKNGKFKIEFDELKKIVSAFMIDNNTKKQLYDAYLYEKLGKDKYNSRRLAKEFLESMHYVPNDDLNFPKSIHKSGYIMKFDIGKEVKTITGKLAVRNAVTMVMLTAHQNNDKIRIISSPFNDFLHSIILTITSTSPQLEIEHIYSLAAVNELPEPSTYYMSVAKAVYPIFMLNTNYNAYYSVVGHATNALMPYYVITKDFSLAIAPDSESAILITEESVIKLQAHLFDVRRKKSTQFINKISTLKEYFVHYCSMIKTTLAIKNIDCFYSIDYEPCILNYLNEEEFYSCIEVIRDDQELVELLQSFVQIFYRTFVENKQISFFTKEGLCSFIEKGTIAEIPGELGLVLPMKRRKEVLQRVLDTMKDPRSKKVYYLINDNEFAPPLGLRFLGAGTNADHLFVISDQSEGMSSILSLSNREINSIVFEFIKSLPETDMVYSHDEMVKYMEETIRELEIRS